MTIDQYIANINNRFQLGNASEHTFRGDLQQLLESVVPDIRATNEPKRQSCGALDYILTINERNIQALSDDYIKFISYGQHFIEKTEEGILAYI